VLSAVTASLLVCFVILQRAYSHRPNKELDEANKQRSSNSSKHDRRPPEDGQTVVTETCRVLIMCFTNIFNNLVF
jgi:hypothetical protein